MRGKRYLDGSPVRGWCAELVTGAQKLDSPGSAQRGGSTGSTDPWTTLLNRRGTTEEERMEFVLGLTQGRGVDLAYEAVGSPGLWSRASSS